MNSVDRRAFLGMASGLMSFLCRNSGPARSLALAPACDTLPIPTSFLQPVDVMRGRSQSRWRRDLSELKRLGCQSLYLQWTELNGSSFVDPVRSRATRKQFLSPVFAAAEEVGLKLWIGLAADLRYLSVYQASAEDLSSYLSKMRKGCLKLASTVHARFGDSTAFAGWYVPEEIDDVTISTPARAEVWTKHLSEIQRGLRALREGVEVSISSYVVGHTDPSHVADFWRRVWGQVPIRVLLQDGFGVRHLNQPERIEAYMSAIATEAVSANGKWGVVIELFEQTSVGDEPFRAIPASLDRLAAQIALVDKFPSAVRSSYSMTEHMVGSAAARRLASEYLRRYCKLVQP
jgi:hypothetical protein